MNLVFNEISFLPLTDNDHTLKENFLEMIKVFQKAKQDFAFTHVVFPANIRDIKVTSAKTFLEWAYNILNQGDKNKILSVVKRPFVEEVLAEQAGDLTKYYYKNIDEGISESYCSGLATGHVKGSLCSSLSSQAFWDKTEIGFHKIINDEFETEPVSANNVSKEEHLAADCIKEFIEYLGNVTLVETQIPSDNKPIALRNDHGRDKLEAFSKKICRSPHVLSIINSLPFNPQAINLIKKIYPNGRIEMVLYWEDRGIGIVIQTTGRNYRETAEIARILKDEFDK
jgi:hypothetical protein